MNNYYVINLEEVTIKKGHPYTLIFKGFIPTYGTNKLYTFEYNGDIETDAMMPEEVKREFTEQLKNDYGVGIMFDKKEIKKQLKLKKQYKMKM